jgi:hypothetical protein
MLAEQRSWEVKHGKETRPIRQHQQAPQGGHVTAQEQVNDFIESLQQHESWLSQIQSKKEIGVRYA